MIDYAILDENVRDRIAEVIDALADDTHWIDDVIDASDVPNTNEAVKRVIKSIRDASDAVIEL